jgi:uncharacterized protein (DUF924 family)
MKLVVFFIFTPLFDAAGPSSGPAVAAYKHRSSWFGTPRLLPTGKRNDVARTLGTLQESFKNMGLPSQLWRQGPNRPETLPGEETTVIDSDWVQKVLGFWFDELGPDGWFETKETTDQMILARFGGLYGSLFEAAPSMSFDSADEALAAIIVFDQFPRNMFRGQARAFASDDIAAGIARKAVEREFDQQVTEDRRLFFYMPLMHAENLADQEHCVSLTSALPGDLVKYAREHRDIIARFGRFPHRNRPLGRESTPGERAFLAEHKGFGQ